MDFRIPAFAPSNDPLAPLLRRRVPLILIETQEEQAVLARLQGLLGEFLRPLFSWSITRGLQRLDLAQNTNMPPAFGPTSDDVLNAIQTQKERSIYVLFEFEPYIGYATNQRKLREILLRHDCAEHTLIFVSPKLEIPAAIEELAVRAPVPTPSSEELFEMIKIEASKYSKEQGGKRVQLILSSVNAVVRMLEGLNMADARRIAQRVIANDGKICDADLPDIAQAKFELMERAGVLHLEKQLVQLDEIAGLDHLKAWVNVRRPVFMGESGAGLDPPKGLLMLGVQGCGKSLAAKAVASGFRVPLVRLDMASVHDKYQGESERKLRDSLQQATQMAPCVLWIDEIEKGMAQGGTDDAVSRRILGYFLTWMSERKKAVFVVATANQIDALPPELLRKGRFDEIFFVDLPRAAARRKAFAIHLQKRKQDPSFFDLDALALACAGFSGAEIEQAVIAASYSAHAQSRAIDSDLILAEIRKTKPLSVVMAEPIAALREWARTRTVSADEVPE